MVQQSNDADLQINQITKQKEWKYECTMKFFEK